MANKLTIKIVAENAIKAGLAKAGASLKAFAGGVRKSAVAIGNAFKMIAKGVLIMGTAAVGAATVAIRAFSKQESAEKSLAAALRAAGDNVDAMIPKYKALASAIQDATGIGDEQTLQLMAQARLLGVNASQMEKVVKGAYALTKVGMGEEQALRAMSAAIEGNFTMFTRYIPALKMATTAEEKMRLVTELTERGYQSLEEELNTVAGRTQELKGRWGDFLEVIGKGIVESASMSGSMARLSEKIKDLTKRTEAWAAGGGFERVALQVKLFASEFLTRMKLIGTAGSQTFSIIGKSAAAPFKFIGTLLGQLGNAVVETFTFAGKYAAAVWKKITHPGQKFQPPDNYEMLAALANVGTDLSKTIPDAPAAFGKMWDDINRISAKGAENESKIIEKWRADQKAAQAKLIADKKKGVGEIVQAGEDEAKAEAVKAKEEIKAIQDRIAAARELIAEKQELANKAVADIIAERKAEKDKVKQEGEDRKRAEELMAREKRGTKLSKSGREFLDAFKAKEAARIAIQGEKDFLAGQKVLAEKLKGKIDQKQLTELEKIRKDINQLLRMK